MKKILFSGLPADVTEMALHESLQKLGPVHSVLIIADGDPSSPAAIVEMSIDDEQAHKLTSRVTDYWHNGHMINARLLLH
ncbi:MAG: RNA-binding protein [Rhodocyclaceae bacterium]|nr:RNA-binding protein [Rhodocyclaceae bacterium]